MTKKKPKKDTVEVREDGQRHLVRGDSKFRLAARAHVETTKEVLADRHEEKMAKVRLKKALQRQNNWPTDKSPI